MKMMQPEFKGDVTALEAWSELKDIAGAALIDVRTAVEWSFVGGADLTSLQKSVYRIEWQKFPGWARNESFIEEVLAAGLQKEQPLYLICRSGVRSKAAALELASHGYTTYNIADGFEGQLDADGHRGVGGWRALGLSWKQT